MKGRSGGWPYVAAVLGVVAVGAGVWWGWLGPRRGCAGSERELAGVWDEARREALRQAFLATRQPYAESTWRVVEQQAGRYLQGWQQARQQACEATRVRGEQTEQVLELRLRCLERRRQEVAALVEVLASVQGPELAQSSRATEQLTPLVVCTDVADLAAHEQLPEDPSVRARVEALQEKLVYARALLLAGRYTQGLEQASSLAEAAEATGFQPLMAEAWLLLARLQYFESVDAHLVIQSAHRAARAFLASGQPQGVARAWIELVTVQQRLGKPAAEEQQQWLQYLEASLGAAGNPAPLRADYERRLAHIRTLQGRYAEGLAHARRAVALTEQLFGPQTPQTANARLELLRAAWHSAEYEEALAAGQQALAYWRAMVGLEHPATVRVLNLLGAVQNMTGRLAEGAATYEQVLLIQERLSSTAEVELVVTLNNLAATYLDQGRYPEGARLIERALATLDRMKVRDSPHRVIALQNLAEMRCRQGEYAQALELAREAVAQAERVTSPQSIISTAALTTLGEAELGTGEVARAVASLERALKLLEAGAPQPKELGRARFALARALQRQEPTRSRALLQQARQDLDQAGPVAQRLRASLDAWLQQHKLPQR